MHVVAIDCMIFFSIGTALEVFLKRWNVKQKQLEATCDENLFGHIITKIASHVAIAQHLIGEVRIFEIQRNCPNDYEKLKLEVLNLWKRINGADATYLALVNAFLEIEDKSVAECIIEYVKKRTGACDAGIDCPPEENQVAIVQQKFLACITHIAESFYRCNISVDEAKFTLIQSCQLPKNDLAAVNSLQELFYKVKSHCSWFNHQPVEILLEKLKCDDAAAELKVFQHSCLEPYLAPLAIHEIPPASFSSYSQAAVFKNGIYQFRLALDDRNLQLTAKEALVIKKHLAGLLLSPLLELIEYDAQKMQIVFAILKDVYECAPSDSPLRQYVVWDNASTSHVITADIVDIL